MPAAATAGLARRTKGAAMSAYPKTGTAGDGALEAKPRQRSWRLAEADTQVRSV